MNYWLMKTEPSTYSWEDLVKDKKTDWDGVRSYEARNNIRAMKPGDLVFIYHSVSERLIHGIARITSEAYPDSTAEEGDWSTIDLEPVKEMTNPVSLDEVKSLASLQDMALVRKQRLSVQPVKEKEWNQVLKMGKTEI